MKSIRRYPLLFLGLALIATMLMSACSQGSASNLTTLQIIQNSANAMKNVKTSHEDVNATFKTNGINVNGLDTRIPSNFTVKGSGDESLADKKQKMDLTLTLPTTSVQASDVVAGNKAYVKVGQGQWYVLDKSKFDQAGGSLVSNLLSGTTLNENSLLSVIQNVNVTDHGDENLNGQSLRHITANLDKAGFEKLLASNPQWTSMLSPQDLSNALKNVKDFNASLDLYIDENQFYVHRTQLKVNLGINNDGKTSTTTMEFTIDLSKFNQPVTITVPANATPLTDPQQLLNGVSGL